MKKTLATALFSFSVLFVTHTQAFSAPPSVYSDQSNYKYNTWVSSPSARKEGERKYLILTSSSNEPTCCALTLSCLGKERYEKFLAWKAKNVKIGPGRF